MDTQQIIKERLAVLPEDIKQAIQSADLGTRFEKIAQKHGLLIDQNGSLQTETILVMLGLEPTSDYIDNIQRELEVSRNEAVSISNDVNTEIFSAIRSSLQSMQASKEEGVEEDGVVKIEETPKVTSTIPQPKIFTPEKPPVGMGGYPTTQTPTPSINREAVLKGIEDPDEPEKVEEITLTDHLLSAPVQSASQVETKRAPVVAPTTPVVPAKKPSILDPYREQI